MMWHKEAFRQTALDEYCVRIGLRAFYDVDGSYELDLLQVEIIL